MARWTGYGRIARTLDAPADTSGEWVDGYRFFVSVQDNGEPGLNDEWRIRIMEKDSPMVLFDSNTDLGYIFDIDPICRDNNDYWNCTEPPKFLGDSLGGEGEAFGGGNVQIHCHGGPPTQTCENSIPQVGLAATGGWVLIEEERFYFNLGSWVSTGSYATHSTMYGGSVEIKKGSEASTMVRTLSNVAAFSQIKVIFDYCSEHAATGDNFSVGYSTTSADGPWTSFVEYISNDMMNCVEDQEGTIMFTSGSVDTVWIRFQGTMDTNQKDYIYIDKARIEGLPR
jgi:hypothetical protein